MRICTQMDGVHPRARECETDSATVQGHSEHSSRVSHANTQGEWCLSSPAIVTGSSTLSQSMIAVTYNGRQQ